MFVVKMLVVVYVRKNIDKGNDISIKTEQKYLILN